MNLNNGAVTIVIFAIVVLAGGVVTILHPESLSFAQYTRDVAVGGGLLGIGHGLDNSSRP